MKNLKKITFITVLLFFLSQSLFAQIAIKPAIGFNFTSLSKEPANFTTSADLGWEIGASIALGGKTYGEGGIFWVNKSNSITDKINNLDFSTDFSGIRIPLMLGYHFIGSEGSMLGLRGFAGTSIFFLNTVDVKGISSNDFKSANYGLFLGAGVDFSMFFVDLMYEWSLNDVSKVSTFDIGTTKSFFLKGGVRLGL